MKTIQRFILIAVVSAVLGATLLTSPARAGVRQQTADTATPTPLPTTVVPTTPAPTTPPPPTGTPTPTSLPSATPTLAPTATPSPTVAPTLPVVITPTQKPVTDRPILVITNYKVNPETPKVGTDFKIRVTLHNNGKAQAYNVILTFDAGTFLPLRTGGVLAMSDLAPGKEDSRKQPFTVSSAAEDGANLLRVTVSYTDEMGNSYSESYMLTVNVKGAWSGGYVSPTATPTPVPGDKPLLVITSYETDINPLRPGDQFTLKVNIANTGSQEARRISMAFGGATVSSSGSSDDENNASNTTVSMSGGDFSRFAPIGASNVQTLGDLPAGGTLQASQPLIVGITTAAGAYSLKISFVYTDKDGRTRVDDQVVTLMVYNPPELDISFYQPVENLTVNEPAQIPLQVVNLGKQGVVLGHITVSSASGQWEKNTAIIGSIAAGDFYSLDATFTPAEPGPQDIRVTVEYTDDFNHPQVITKTLQVEVQEPAPMEDFSMDEFAPPAEAQPTTLWDKIVQFFKGLFGLGSGVQDG